MIQIFAVIIGLLLVTLPAAAQIYGDKHQEIIAPMDKAIEQTNALYANEAFPGDDQAARPQGARYSEMTGGINDAISRHFDTVVNEIK